MAALPILAALALFLAAGCDDQSGALKDGYYTAEVADYGAEGWREYLTIYVNDGAISTAEFNAANRSGLLRSWDQDYIHQSYLKYRVNPNLFPRLYASYLVTVQDPGRVQPVSRGRRTHEVFVRLAEAAIGASLDGDASVRSIQRPPTAHPDDI
jgi:major membrane immunogen (membrane-anchored lipoprotein)